MYIYICYFHYFCLRPYIIVKKPFRICSSHQKNAELGERINSEVRISHHLLDRIQTSEKACAITENLLTGLTNKWSRQLMGRD